MIENWEQFFSAVCRMREHRKLYFQTKDPVALGMARKLEKLVDECIADRQERTGKQAKSGNEDTEDMLQTALWNLKG